MKDYDITHVIHCAGVVDFQGTPFHLLMNVNVLGTRNIITAAELTKVKSIVATSSSAVIGVAGGNSNYKDTGPLPEPKDLIAGQYGITKQIAEKEILLANNSSNFTTACVRPNGVYGM